MVPNAPSSLVQRFQSALDAVEHLRDVGETTTRTVGATAPFPERAQQSLAQVLSPPLRYHPEASYQGHRPLHNCDNESLLQQKSAQPTVWSDPIPPRPQVVEGVAGSEASYATTLVVALVGLAVAALLWTNRGRIAALLSGRGTLQIKMRDTGEEDVGEDGVGEGEGDGRRGKRSGASVVAGREDGGGTQKVLPYGNGRAGGAAISSRRKENNFAFQRAAQRQEDEEELRELRLEAAYHEERRQMELEEAALEEGRAKGPRKGTGRSAPHPRKIVSFDSGPVAADREGEHLREPSEPSEPRFFAEDPNFMEV